MNRLLREKERIERKVERMRAKTKQLKKSMKKAEVQLRRIEKQFDETWIVNRKVYQDNALADAFIHINLAMFEAEVGRDFLTAKQLDQILRDLMVHGDEENQDEDDDGADGDGGDGRGGDDGSDGDGNDAAFEVHMAI